MANTTTTGIGDLVKQAQGMFALNPMIFPQMEHFWEAQENILAEAEAFTHAWFERRHAAAKSALGVAREVSGHGGTDPAKAMKAIADWQRDSMERLTNDIQGWVDLCARCASHVASAETEAAAEGVEEVEKRAAQAVKAKHATPV